MDGTAPDVQQPFRPIALFATWLTGVLVSAALGALTNSINGWVSPLYFRAVLNWHLIDDVWRASVAQGVLEGTCFGLFFALAYGIGVGVITDINCTYSFALRHLSRILAASLVCWVVGGLLAVALASISPELYRQTFMGVPREWDLMLRYAWVGGSIWGLELGGFACVVMGLIMLRADWRRHRRTEMASNQLALAPPLSTWPKDTRIRRR